MSYRCEVCDRPQKPHKTKLRHLILRPNGSIRRELAVCGGCKHFLDLGESLESLRKRLGPKQVQPLALVVNRPVQLGTTDR